MQHTLKTLLTVLLICVHFSVLAKNPQGSISTFSLENGLKIVVLPDNRSPVVMSQLWYKVGSAYEPHGLTGISHVLEHMMFKGTPRFSQGKFSKIIAEHGGQQNAFTSTDYTAYYQEVAKEHLAICFELEADRMQHLLFDSAEFKKELNVVKEERRMRVDDNPMSASYERFLAAAHVSSPYHHMPIGWMNDLDHLELEDVKRWYETWYRPNNAILVVVGDVEPNAVFQLAEQYFSPIPSVPVPQLKPHHFLKGLGLRSIEVHLPANLSYLLAGYNVPTYRTIANKKEAYALELIAALLNGKDGLLNKTLIHDQKLAVSVNADYDLYDLFDGVFTFSFVPRQGVSFTALEKALGNQIERLKKGQIDKARLKRAKKQLMASEIYHRDSLLFKAMQIGQLESVGLGYTLAASYLSNIQDVTVADMQRAAKKYFVSDQLIVARLKPKALQQHHH